MTPLNKSEIAGMRLAGKTASHILACVGKQVKVGVSTEELNLIAHQITEEQGATSAPLNYKGYPKSICTSVNHCICHGLPGGYRLKEGDIVNIDITCVKAGFHGDTSRTFYVGEVSHKAKSLTECAYQAMLKGIEKVKAQGTTGDIGFAINKYVTRRGFYPVKEIGGHGIGKNFHQEPFVPSSGKKRQGTILPAGYCITVEPMVNETNAPVKECEIKGSEIKYYETSDRSLSAQFEHTVLITEEGCEILTQAEEEFEVGY